MKSNDAQRIQQKRGDVQNPRKTSGNQIKPVEGKKGASSKEKEKASKARYRERNREKLREKGRAYARRKRSDPSFREEENAKQRARRANDPTWKERSSLYAKTRMQNPEIRERRYAYSRKYMAEYRIRPHVQKRQYEYFKNRLEYDVFFRMRLNLSCRMRIGIKKQLGNKAKKTMELIGCSVSHLRKHLESKFEPWMNWSNYGMGDGKWVIDHIRPCISFDLTNEHEQKRCFNWTNLQPLSWRKNSEKRAKYTT